MKVGDLVRHPLSGEIGIITDDSNKDADIDLSYYTVWLPSGEFLIPQEHLETIA